MALPRLSRIRNVIWNREEEQPELVFAIGEWANEPICEVAQWDNNDCNRWDHACEPTIMGLRIGGRRRLLDDELNQIFMGMATAQEMLHKKQCFTCRSSIKYKHAFAKYFDEFNVLPLQSVDELDEWLAKFNKLWENEEIQFLCCNCKDKANMFENDKKERIDRILGYLSDLKNCGYDVKDALIVLDELRNQETPSWLELELEKKKHQVKVNSHGHTRYITPDIYEAWNHSIGGNRASIMWMDEYEQNPIMRDDRE